VITLGENSGGFMGYGYAWNGLDWSGGC